MAEYFDKYVANQAHGNCNLFKWNVYSTSANDILVSPLLEGSKWTDEIIPGLNKEIPKTL